MIAGWLWPAITLSRAYPWAMAVLDSPINGLSGGKARHGRITVTLPGAANDGDVLSSAIRYAVCERALLRIVLSDEHAGGAFQDQLHLALLRAVRSFGKRPNDVEVLRPSLAGLPSG